MEGCVATNSDLIEARASADAYLAGALAWSVWLMLPSAPDFRWMLGRGDSPWYPTMRLYRQPSGDHRASVIAAIQWDLDDLR